MKVVGDVLGWSKKESDKLPLKRDVKPTKSSCTAEVADKVNNWDNIETAFAELKKEHKGKKSFDMSDIVKQINKAKPSDNFKFKE